MPINKNALRLLTDEELKAEVKRRGYIMSKQKKYKAPLACVCGNDSPHSWLGFDGVYFECGNCNLKTESFKTQRKAMLAWNELIEKERQDRHEKNP